MDNIFCVAWYCDLSSGEDKSKSNNLEPTNNCNTIEAVTIGPIPNVKIEPKLPAITALNWANWSTAAELKPYNGISVNIKYNTKIRAVHLSFSLKSSWWTGDFTSGKNLNNGSKTFNDDILFL